MGSRNVLISFDSYDPFTVRNLCLKIWVEYDIVKYVFSLDIQFQKPLGYAE
jgi:hypothetical protein